MRVRETLKLNIPDQGVDVESLEQYLARELEVLGKRALVKAD